MSLAEARARWGLGLLSPGHMRWVAWAAQAEGHDGPAIRGLAAEEWHTWNELGDLPERLFAETRGGGDTDPSPEEAALLLARAAAAAVMRGETTLRDAAGEIAYLAQAAVFAHPSGGQIALHGRLNDFWTLDSSYRQHEDWQRRDEEHARIGRELDERALRLARTLLEETQGG